MPARSENIGSEPIFYLPLTKVGHITEVNETANSDQVLHPRYLAVTVADMGAFRRRGDHNPHSDCTRGVLQASPSGQCSRRSVRTIRPADSEAPSLNGSHASRDS